MRNSEIVFMYLEAVVTEELFILPGTCLHTDFQVTRYCACREENLMKTSFEYYVIHSSLNIYVCYTAAYYCY